MFAHQEFRPGALAVEDRLQYLPVLRIVGPQQGGLARQGEGVLHQRDLLDSGKQPAEERIGHLAEQRDVKLRIGPLPSGMIIGAEAFRLGGEQCIHGID